MIAPVHPPSDTDDPLATRLFGVMIRLMKSGQPQVMSIAAEFELTMSQLRMLFVLDHASHDLAVNELAERVALSMAAAGRAVDALHRSGLVSRREDDSDRRIKRLALTAKGRDAIRQIHVARLDYAHRFVADLNANERERLSGAIETLAELTELHPLSEPDALCAHPPAGGDPDHPTTTTAAESTP